MDPNDQNVLQQMHMETQMNAHIMNDQLNHTSVDQNCLPSINHSQMDHAQLLDPSVECTTNESPNRMVDHLNETDIHMTQINLPEMEMSASMGPIKIESNIPIKLGTTRETRRSAALAASNKQKESQSGEPSTPDPDLTCDICQKTYESKKFLNYHYTYTHKTQKKNIKCAFTLQNECQEVFRIRKDYEEHLQNDHNCVLDIKTLTFEDVAEFDHWKQQMEESTASQFLINRASSRHKKGMLLRAYKCSRSGEKIRTAGKRQRKNSEKGPMGAECPARIKIVKCGDGKVECTFISTHLGHNIDSIPRNTHQIAKKQIAIKRMKLEEKNKSFNARKIRTERLSLQRNDIIEELNYIDLTAEGTKGDRVEKLLNMIRLSLDLFKDNDSSNNGKKVSQQNGNEQDDTRLASLVHPDSVNDIFNQMY